MNEKLIRLRPKPLLLWFAVLFVVCFLPLLAFFRSDNTWFTVGMSLMFSAMAGIAGSLAFCTIVEVVSKFRSGDLGLPDLLAPGIVAGVFGVLILGYILLPDAASVIKIYFLPIFLIVWIVHATTRRIRQKELELQGNKGTMERRYAGFWIRAAAVLLDSLLFGIPVFLLVLCTSALPLSRTLYLAKTVLPACIIFPYFIYFHGRWGQTVGKMIMRIKVVRTDGGRIGYRVAALRSIVNIGFALLFVAYVAITLSGFPEADWAFMSKPEQLHAVRTAFPLPDFGLQIANLLWLIAEIICLLQNAKKRAVHDYIAGTIVVRLRKDTDQKN